VGGKTATHEILELGGQLRRRLGPRGEDDESLHELAAHLVRAPDDGGEGHGRMPKQALLDLAAGSPRSG
jgi:hypothetical protein